MSSFQSQPNNSSTDKRGILEGYKPAEMYTPSQEERDLISRFLTHFEESRNYRLAWERQWELSRLYLKGQQLILRNRTTGEVFRLPQDDSHRLLAINNILRPTARTLLGKLTKLIPAWKVVPPSADLNDIRGCETATSLLQHIRRKERVDRKYIDLYRHVILSGTGLIKLCWDKNAGRDIAHCEECGYQTYEKEEVGNDCPQCAAEEEQGFSVREEQYKLQTSVLGGPPESGSFGGFGQDQGEDGVENEAGEILRLIQEIEKPEREDVPKLKAANEGDVSVDNIDYRDFYIDSSAVSIESAQWCCHRIALPVSEVRDRFPKKGKYVDADPGIYAEQHVTILQNVANLRSDVRQLEDHVYLYEFHEKPTEEHPDGRIVYTAGDIVLEEVENPYKNLGRLPFYTFYWEPNIGEFWGESFIEQSWTMQRELNLLLTQMREHRELTNRPKLFIPMGTGITGEEYDTTAGQIFQFNAMAGKPFFGDIPSFPNYVYNEAERFERQIQTQASVSEQDVGVSGSETSGRYAAIMEAQAAQQVGPILRYNQTEWVELGRGILILCQEFYSDKRSWAITGSDRPITYEFKDMNLNPGWDVDVQEDDSMSTNQAVRFDQALSLYQAGIFVDQATGQPDIKAFADKAGVKLPGMGPDTRGSDHAKAAAIPGMIEHGQMREPKEWDDPDAFAEELLAWLKGPGETEEDQGLVAKVAEVWRHYMQASQAAIAQQQQATQAGQGGSAPAGGDMPPTEAGANLSGNPGNSASALPEAEQGVQQADQAAVAATKGGQPQEG